MAPYDASVSPSAPVTPPSVAGPLRLEPFRGLMLAPSRVGDPSSARAFARPYRDVTKRVDRWERQGRILRDREPAVYLHEYTAGGITVRGIVGALDLSRRADTLEERVILPHEGLHPVQASELAARMTQMALNPAPILLVHRGPQAARDLLGEVTAAAPDHDFTDRSMQHHRVWAIRDTGQLDRLAEALASSRALIADGHHRYAAYLRMQQEHPGGATDRGLAMLVDQDDTPLFLGAIHRVLVGTAFVDISAAAAPLGTYRTVSATEAVAALGPDTLVLTDGTAWGTLTLADDDRAAVEVLHERLVPALPRQPRRVAYHHSVDTTLTDLARSPAVAVLMPAPDYDVVRRILAADRLLPEKATSFQPKPSLGVLMRSLLDE